MMRTGVAVMLSAIALTLPQEGEGQSWPERRSESEVQWIVGSYVPVTRLGSFGDYTVSMDPWLSAGVAIRSGAADRTFRTRFEVVVVPSVAMRRNPVGDGSEECDGCTSDSLRLTLLNSRFLFDATLPVGSAGRAYLTGGPSVRYQMSEPRICLEKQGEECALPEFGRPRVDPGLMAGIGWEPTSSRIRGIQLTGRMSLYGRGESSLSAPRSWLPELDVTVRFAW